MKTARFDLSDVDCKRIRPMLPTKPRGVARVDDRRVLLASSGLSGPALAGSALPLRPAYEDLQPFQSLCKGGRLSAGICNLCKKSPDSMHFADISIISAQVPPPSHVRGAIISMGPRTSSARL